MHWKHVEKMQDLSADELYGVLKLRQDVFIIEQDCIYNDIDNLDQQSEHLLMLDGETIAAYSRIVPAGTKFGLPSIGRIVVSPDYRGQGCGRAIVKKSIALILQKGVDQIAIEAQEYLRDFYEELGFKKNSELYDLDGIPHIKMIYTKGS